MADERPADRVPTAGERLGFGLAWTPAPFRWAWGHIEDDMTKRRTAVLRLDTAAGVIGVAFDPDDLDRFVEAAGNQAALCRLGGLAVPHSRLYRPDGVG